VNSYTNNKQRHTLDVDLFHEKQKQNQFTDAYLHTKQLFDTLNSGLKKFQYIEVKNKLDDVVNVTYDSIANKALHTTTTSIQLFEDKQYFSLDDNLISNNIYDITNDHIIDCNNHDISVDDYYIGTHNSNNANVHEHSNNGAKVGFIFSRQVTRLEDININSVTCKKVTTELVHPIQIMDTEIVSEISFPYNRIYVPTDRNLLEKSSFLRPDSPLLLCTDEKFLSKQGSIHKNGGDTINVHGIPIDYDYALDIKGNECIDLSATVPGSINFNHASGTKAINQLINLGNGVTCSNCYSFLGAGILAVFNVFGGKASTFAFEAKDAGGAGFNIEIVINNPTISAAKYFNLAKEGPVSSIPIVAGLSLDVNFGGAWATVKGSGSAQGKATFSSGYTLLEEDHIMYANSRWSAQYSLINSNQLEPKYSNNGIRLSTTSLSVIVSISARIRYSFGGSIPVVNVGAKIDFSSVLTATAQFIKGAAAQSLSLSMDNAERSLFSRFQIEKYYPGDSIHFKINYSGLNPNEEHHLYFNLHKPSDSSSGFPIKMHKFRSSKSGNGEIKTEWKIPHDTKFSQDNCNHGLDFSVHSSSRTDRYFSPKKICIMQRRSGKEESIINYPNNGLSLTINRGFIIKWNKDALKYFKHKPGTDGLGSEEIPNKINILLISVDNGKAYQIAANVNNTGSYYIRFDGPLFNNEHRYFIALHDSNEYSHIAWQKGHFTIKRHTHNTSSISFSPVDIESPILENGSQLWKTVESNNTNNNANYNIRRSLAGPEKCPREALSIMLQIEFGFDGFTVLGKKIPLGSTASNPFVIIPQTNFCLK